jgi:hypothetical protein
MGPVESKVKSEPSTFQGQSKLLRFSPFIRDWEIQLRPWPIRMAVVAVVLAVGGAVLYHTWWLLLAAWITRGSPPPADPAIYERAIRYDPKNADYHFYLAQIYNYSTQYLDIARAGREYEATIRLNPYRTQHWLELSKYYEQQKDYDRCRDAMKKALERDPNYAQVHWAAANLYIRLNDLKTADFELRRTADLDVMYLPQTLDLVWRFYEDPDRIMATHVPNTREANLIALNYFLAHESQHGAELAWSKLKTFTTSPLERVTYIDYLVTWGKPHEAWNVFTFPSVEPEGQIFNPSFETEPLNKAFDWRFVTTEHAEARRDTTTVKSGMAAWLVNFDGKENIDYSGLGHWIPVTKGKSYKLSFWIRTEAITTNEGMFVEVDGQTSEKQVGTTYWQQLTIPFTASSDLVTIHLRRVPSKKLDNLLKGKVWLDDFTLN